LNGLAAVMGTSHPTRSAPSFSQRNHSGQYGLRFGKVYSAEAREQALFIIRGVLRGGFAEVAQAGLQKPVPSGHCVDGWRVCWLAG